MSELNSEITCYDDALHRLGVVDLWKRVFGYSDAHNDPELSIDKKLAVKDNLFWVAERADEIVGTIMAGYDGHRGWIYSLAVHPDCRSCGLGSELVNHAEESLAALGCMKVNLQIMSHNGSVKDFYLANGYSVEERISMGKRLQSR